MMQIVGIKSHTYNSWRNRGLIRNIAKKSGVRSRYTKTDVMKCLIMKALSTQGVTYPIGFDASKIITQKLEWEEATDTFVDVVNGICTDAPDELEGNALLYVYLEGLRNHIDNFEKEEE